MKQIILLLTLLLIFLVGCAPEVTKEVVNLNYEKAFENNKLYTTGTVEIKGEDVIIDNTSSEEFIEFYETHPEAKYILQIPKDITEEELLTIATTLEPVKTSVIVEVTTLDAFNFFMANSYEVMVKQDGTYSTQDLINMSLSFDVYINFDYAMLSEEDLLQIDSSMSQDMYFNVDDVNNFIETYTPFAVINKEN